MEEALTVTPFRHFDTLVVDPRSGAPSDPSRELVLRSGIEARLLLTSSRYSFSRIVLAADATQPGCLSLIAQARRHRPSVPLHILYEGEIPFSLAELARLGIDSCIERSAGHPRSLPNVARTVEAVAALRASGPTAAAEPEAGFHPVSTLEFLAGARSLFDTYVRVNSGKLLKVLEVGDAFDAERIESYVKHGVHWFYLKRESWERSLLACAATERDFLESPDMSIGVKLTALLNRGERAAEEVRTRGLDEEVADVLDDYLGHVQHWINLALAQPKTARRAAIESIFRDSRAYDHAVLSTLIAGLVATHMGITTPVAFHEVGLAAFLHDVGVKLSHDQEPNHPVRGAELLRALPGVSESVVQAVLQHHERRDRSGYPLRPAADQISRMAEVIGLADAFSKELGATTEATNVTRFLTRLSSNSPDLDKAFRAIWN